MQAPIILVLVAVGIIIMVLAAGRRRTRLWQYHDDDPHSNQNQNDWCLHCSLLMNQSVSAACRTASKISMNCLDSVVSGCMVRTLQNALISIDSIRLRIGSVSCHPNQPSLICRAALMPLTSK